MALPYETGTEMFTNGSLELVPQYSITTEASGRSLDIARQVADADVIDLVTAREDVTAAFYESTSQVVTTEANPTLHAVPVVPATEKVETKIEKPKYSTRHATEEDIETLVDIDMKAFAKVYAGYDQPHDELRDELIGKFRGRYDKLGGRWIRIAEKDGEPVGFTVACPTSKSPDDFESWEKTTDNGTLETTYDPKGEYVYVTSLSMLDGAGEVARNMLFTNMLSEATKGGYKSAYFESRLPGLRTWMKRESTKRGSSLEDLDEADKAEMASTYFDLKITRKGKELPYDFLMRIYAQAGCKFVKLVTDAYADEPSMNFGAIGVFENPVPRAILRNRVARNIVGKGMDLVAKSQWAVKKLF